MYFFIIRSGFESLDCNVFVLLSFFPLTLQRLNFPMFHIYLIYCCFQNCFPVFLIVVCLRIRVRDAAGMQRRAESGFHRRRRLHHRPEGPYVLEIY